MQDQGGDGKWIGIADLSGRIAAMSLDAADALRKAGRLEEAAKLDELAIRASKARMDAMDFQSGADSDRL